MKIGELELAHCENSGYVPDSEDVREEDTGSQVFSM
ncbi:hypothetical protein FVER14953_20414 [Fusarium verticillioides]|nr:hypothetical protein FVER14953_20414 [Fusarium verticillioides]